MLAKQITNNLLLFGILIISFGALSSCDRLKIYDNLIQCYRNNNTIPWMPSNLNVLIEIIRKVEFLTGTSYDIRTLSVSLIHKLRIDGIQRANGIQETEDITPYDTTGLMTPKMETLQTLISPIPGMIDFDKILTASELCTLHKLISSSVEENQRGDEQSTCLKRIENYANLDRVVITHSFPKISEFFISHTISRCPIEMGTVRTYDYGTIAPGVVIASIAAGLQPQSVTLKELFPKLQERKDRYSNLETMRRRDTDIKIQAILKSMVSIDNTFASNLAGDLAEVIVYQTPYYGSNISIGSSGYWDDTEYPKIRYLNDQLQLSWTMTDAEVLAGIDAFHLASDIRGWINRMNRMRLSQVLEMYYSNQGVPSFEPVEKGNPSKNFDDLDDGISFQLPGQLLYHDMELHVNSACDREQTLNRIPRDRLKDQTFYFAQILQQFTNTVTVPYDELRRSSYAAVDRFFEHAHKLVQAMPKCANILRPPIDLTLIIDGSRNKIENLRLISYVSEIIDVSIKGSKISVVHGTTGEYLVQSTSSIVDAFDQLQSFQENPSKLSLTDSFSSIIQKMSTEPKENHYGGISQVILVVSQQNGIVTADFENAKKLFEGSFRAFPHLYFVFLTNNVQTFEDLTKDVRNMEYTEKESYAIIESSMKDPLAFSQALITSLRKIPKWLQIGDCINLKNLRNDTTLERPEFEDYVSRNQVNLYRISAKELMANPNLHILFQGTDYGAIDVCMTRNSKQFQCQSTLRLNEESLWFNISEACHPNQVYDCKPITFRVELDTSKVKCFETDCRYPDQVRYYIRLESDKCSNGSSSSLLFYSYVVVCLNIFIIFVKFLY